MIAVDRFETARLRAEPTGPEHQSELAALFGDPRVGATLLPLGAEPGCGRGPAFTRTLARV